MLPSTGWEDNAAPYTLGGSVLPPTGLDGLCCPRRRLIPVLPPLPLQVGFFKRGFKEKLEEATDETGDAGGAVDQPSVPQA